MTITINSQPLLSKAQGLGAPFTDVFHVFLIANPIIAMTSRMYVEAMSISPEKVICVSIRNCDTTLVSPESINQKIYTIDRVIQKLFDISSAGIRLKRSIEGKCEQFILYTPWMFAEAEMLLSSSRCLGHFYLEEGQLSYYNSKMFTARSEMTFRYRQQQKTSGSVNFHYQDNCLGFIGILPDAFPSMPLEKRIILQNYSDALKAYIPLLKGIECIAVMPTPHRIPVSSIARTVKLVCESMPDGGVIKLHPGYKLYPAHSKSILAAIKATAVNDIKICDDRAILELEMLTEPKRLFGTRSSLVKYAQSFGSTYTFINFPDYEQPNN